MESTGEPDRKRRHFSSFSPTAAANKHPAFFCSDDKKHGLSVLQFQNQKLVQQLEVHKAEYSALESKYRQLEEKENSYDEILEISKNTLERLVGDLESHSVCMSGYANGGAEDTSSRMLDGGACCPPEDDFVTKLLVKEAIDCSSNGDDLRKAQPNTRNLLRNILSTFNHTWSVHDKAVSALRETLSKEDSNRQLQKVTNDLQMEVKNCQVAIRDLHLKHRILSNNVQNHRDMDTKYKAAHKRLTGELAGSLSELEETNCRLTTLKAQKEAAKGTPFFFQTIGNKQVGADKVIDATKELQELESSLEKMKDLATTRLVEIRSLHEGRVEILTKLASFQNVLRNAKAITSSNAYVSLNDQLDKSKTELDQCRKPLEKLQVEKERIIWNEKEVNVKADLADMCRKEAAFSESHRAELEEDLQKLCEERVMLETKLEGALHESGMKEILAEFKALLASLPKDMDAMQLELRKYKGAASELHSLRSEVRSFSSVADRKANELDSLSCRCAHQLSEMTKLQSVVQELKESDQELKLFLEMYQRESTDSREVMQARNIEYKAWAHVQNLKSVLDEHKLELRVKEANEAEAISQQRLAAAEAEISDIRQNLQTIERDIFKSAELLKSKDEEGEAYLSEIESIGQAYEDIQTQNQHLLQQVTERDECNTKLVLEGLKSQQLHDGLSSDVRNIDKTMQCTNSFMDLLHKKSSTFDDQLKNWSGQVGRLTDDGCRNSNSLGDTQGRLKEKHSAYLHTKQLLDERQPKVDESRVGVAELLVELEKERFAKKRLDENLDVMSQKATCLREHIKSSTVLEKLKQEINEYKGILKCCICRDRQKEVVIAKCFHLFCNQCVQKTLESRHRKCPTCGAAFGQNDVKPVYI